MTVSSKIDSLVPQWLAKAKEMIFASFQRTIDVGIKSNRNDLVTDLDRQIEGLLVKKIKENFPDSQIMSEESHPVISKVAEDKLLWIIDPIDGTMNFVKQKTDFAIMIGIFKGQQPIRGFIYDVMGDQLYHGGPEAGVYCNQQKLMPPPNSHLAEGLLGIGGVMLIHNAYGLQQIALASHGVRIYGSAGMQIIRVLKGQSVAYVSHLHPWDLAAGKILAETLGLAVKTIDGKEPSVLALVDVLVASKNAQKDIMRMAQFHY